MWITPTPNGKYKATERYTDPLTGRTRTLSVTIEKDTAQARKRASQSLSALLSALMDDSTTDISLRKLCDLYLDQQKKTVKPSTYARNDYAMTALCRIIGEDILIGKLTAGYVKAKLLETGEEPGRMNERLKRLKALLR